MTGRVQSLAFTARLRSLLCCCCFASSLRCPFVRHDILKENVHWILTAGQLAVAKHRTAEILKLTELVKDMSALDQAIIDSLSPETRAVLFSKKFASLKRVLADLGYIDAVIATVSCAGFDHTGTLQLGEPRDTPGEPRDAPGSPGILQA
jgi:hypothetical protein